MLDKPRQDRHLKTLAKQSKLGCRVNGFVRTVDKRPQSQMYLIKRDGNFKYWLLCQTFVVGWKAVELGSSMAHLVEQSEFKAER